MPKARPCNQTIWWHTFGGRHFKSVKRRSTLFCFHRKRFLCSCYVFISLIEGTADSSHQVPCTHEWGIVPLLSARPQSQKIYEILFQKQKQVATPLLGSKSLLKVSLKANLIFLNQKVCWNCAHKLNGQCGPPLSGDSVDWPVKSSIQNQFFWLCESFSIIHLCIFLSRILIVWWWCEPQ